ncbi:MAG: hypothetical protein CSA66_00360 [Proteobacteria bacterium]|nr:MAG: hypothetical protein CSA66_00360 [Pseudomonadota bacterium]
MAEPVTRLIATIVAALALSACARDPAMVAWDGAFAAASRAASGGAHGEAVRRLARLEAQAPRPLDAAAARFARVDALMAAGRVYEAATLLADTTRTAPRRPDRARAHYRLAQLAQARGRPALAVQIYRRLVLTYPDLMPGERSLAHLERLLEARGAAGLDAHLTWTRGAYERLRDTALADNLVMHPAELAHRRFVATGQPRWADLALRLYGRVDTEHRQSGLWNDAIWRRSLLYHRLGRYGDEIADIRRLQRTHAKISLFGHDDHSYFWQGQLRVARVQLLELDDPAAAADSLVFYIDRFPDSIWRDDAAFWAGCAYWAADAPERAEAAFARIREINPDSKYLRRVDQARANPRGAGCVPDGFGEAPW